MVVVDDPCLFKEGLLVLNEFDGVRDCTGDFELPNLGDDWEGGVCLLGSKAESSRRDLIELRLDEERGDMGEISAGSTEYEGKNCSSGELPAYVFLPGRAGREPADKISISQAKTI